MHHNAQTSPMDEQETGTNPELLVSAVLHLMSHYAEHATEANACLKLGSIIERHLRALAAYPELPPVLRATCQQLSELWASVVERAKPARQERGFLKRLAGAS